MKSMKWSGVCASVLAAGLVSGCSKSDDSSMSSTIQEAGKKADQAVDSAVAGVKETAKDVTAAAGKTVQDAQDSVSELVTKADTEIRATIDYVKVLINEKKYSEALNVVQSKLSGIKLSEEQQKMVASLKEQIQTALSASSPEATKAVSDLLPKN